MTLSSIKHQTQNTHCSLEIFRMFLVAGIQRLAPPFSISVAVVKEVCFDTTLAALTTQISSIKELGWTAAEIPEQLQDQCGHTNSKRHTNTQQLQLYKKEVVYMIGHC